MRTPRIQRRGRAPRFVLRDTTPLVAFGLAAVVGFILVIDTVIVGDVDAFAITAPFVFAALGVLWLLLVHPHVRYDERDVIVTGIGRVHRLPWSRIATVRQQLSLAFALDDGRTISATGVTAPRDRGIVMSALSRGRLGAGAADAHSNADALRAFRETQVDRVSLGDRRTVDTRWDVVPLGIVGALVFFAVCDALILAVR